MVLRSSVRTSLSKSEVPFYGIEAALVREGVFEEERATFFAVCGAVGPYRRRSNWEWISFVKLGPWLRFLSFLSVL